MSVVVADPLGQSLHLAGVEMIDRDRNAGAAEVRDKFGGLLDCLGTVIVGPDCSCTVTAACADDRRGSFAQGGRDATPGTSGRARDDSHASTQRFVTW